MEHPNIDVVLGVKPAGEPTAEQRAEMHEACSAFNLKEHLDSLNQSAIVANAAGLIYYQLEVEPESFGLARGSGPDADVNIGNSVITVDPVETPEEEVHAEG